MELESGLSSVGLTIMISGITLGHENRFCKGRPVCLPIFTVNAGPLYPKAVPKACLARALFRGR